MFPLYSGHNKIKHVVTKYFIHLNKFYEEYSLVVKHFGKKYSFRKDSHEHSKD